jgi:hypothetical protein
LTAFGGSFLFCGKCRRGGRRDIWASRLLRRAQGRQQCPTWIDQSLVTSSATYGLKGGRSFRRDGVSTRAPRDPRDAGATHEYGGVAVCRSLSHRVAVRRSCFFVRVPHPARRFSAVNESPARSR